MYTQTYNLYLFHEVRLKSSFCFPPFALHQFPIFCHAVKLTCRVSEFWAYT